MPRESVTKIDDYWILIHDIILMDLSDLSSKPRTGLLQVRSLEKIGGGVKTCKIIFFKKVSVTVSFIETSINARPELMK